MALHQNTIHFHHLCPPFYFPYRTHTKQFINLLISEEGRTVENINYIFCTDEYLLKVNQQYLQHDTYTDIITFELSKSPASIIADIYISIERVKENRTTFKSSALRELTRVIFHGALHLCGYKDKTKAHKQAMNEKEDYYLRRFFVSRETL